MHAFFLFLGLLAVAYILDPEALFGPTPKVFVPANAARELPLIEAALVQQKAKWFKSRKTLKRIADLEATRDRYLRIISKGNAEQAAWEAAHPGQSYRCHIFGGYER